MSRNGSGVYSKPAGTTAVANTTILSAKFNEVIDDIVTDLNTARPVVAGGTGATTVATAQTALSVDNKVVFTTKSAGYTAVGTDNNATLRFSTGATLSLTAAATLAANWHLTVIADGGDVIIDPNGAELIDGAATVTIPNGYTAEIYCDGSAFRTNRLWSTLQTAYQPLDADLTAIAAAGVGLHANYLSGFTISNNATDATNDIDISAGVCMDSTNTYFISVSALTKRLDALWTVGTNQGGLDTGSPANQTYHVFAIKRLDTGVTDILMSGSATSPTLPTNYTIFRRIGSIIRSGATILAFFQYGDVFRLNVPVSDFSSTNPGTAAVTRTMTVPTGIVVMPIFSLILVNSTTAAVAALATSLTQTDTTPTNSASQVSSTSAGNRITVIIQDVPTNTSAQIRTRLSASGASDAIAGVTHGWIDTRGRNG